MMPSRSGQRHQLSRRIIGSLTEPADGIKIGLVTLITITLEIPFGILVKRPSQSPSLTDLSICTTLFVFVFSLSLAFVYPTRFLFRPPSASCPSHEESERENSAKKRLLAEDPLLISNRNLSLDFERSNDLF